MVTKLFLVLGLASVLHVSRGQHYNTPCQDLDTPSCEGFHRKIPNLCQDTTFSQNMCKRFCGNCPLECFSCLHPVRDRSACSNVTECSSDEKCVTKHLRATDGHHEYMMRCVDKEVCNLLTEGFGKRDLDIADMEGLSAEDRARFERDIVMDCCDTDLCNSRLMTTTTTTTTTPKPTTTRPTTTPLPTTPDPAKLCYRDIVFVLLNPQSATQDAWLRFIAQIVAQISVGNTHAHVALVTGTRVQWYLIQAHTNSYLSTHITSLEHGNLRADDDDVSIADVISLINSRVLTLGDRPAADNVVVVLDNGGTGEQFLHTALAAKQLHTKSKDVITVALGTSVDSVQLQAIATDNHHIFTARTTSYLPPLAPAVVNKICSKI